MPFKDARQLSLLLLLLYKLQVSSIVIRHLYTLQSDQVTTFPFKCRPRTVCFASFPSFHLIFTGTDRVGVIIVSILQMRKLRLDERG